MKSTAASPRPKLIAMASIPCTMSSSPSRSIAAVTSAQFSCRTLRLSPWFSRDNGGSFAVRADALENEMRGRGGYGRGDNDEGVEGVSPCKGQSGRDHSFRSRSEGKQARTHPPEVGMQQLRGQGTIGQVSIRLLDGP